MQVAEHCNKTRKHREEMKGEIKMRIITSEHSQQLQSKNRQLQIELANSNRELIEMKNRKEKGINELTARIKETNRHKTERRNIVISI